MDDPVLWPILLLAAALAAGALVTTGRLRIAVMGLALALCPVLIAADNWQTDRFEALRDNPEVIVAAVVIGAGAVAALAALFTRRPILMPLLAVGALPFRIPLDAGGQSANLLVPLYAVIAAGIAAAWLAARRGDQAAGIALRPGLLESWPGRALIALAGFLLVYAIQSSYSDDLSKALENACFFFIPFAVLLGLLERVEWNRDLLRWTAIVVVAEAALFALVGLGELIAGDLLWNEEVQASNEIHTYFRVNSLFWDPNILGRYMAITAITVTAALLFWARSGRDAIAAGVIATLVIGALLMTWSQSSFVALFAGLVVLGALRWSVRWVALGAALLLAALVAVVLIDGSRIDFDISDKRSLRLETSGRSELIRGGLELAGDRPVTGYGSGSFEEEFGARFGAGSAAAATASHTEPVTVAAEQGVIGSLVYGTLLVASIAALATGLRAWCPGLRGGGWASGGVVAAARTALAASVAAMLVHSLSYAAFMTDPITWAILGIGLPLAARTPEPPPPAA